MFLTSFYTTSMADCSHGTVTSWSFFLSGLSRFLAIFFFPSLGIARVDFGFSIDYHCVGSYPRYVLLYCPSGGTGKERCNGHWRTCDWMGPCCAGPRTESLAGLQRGYPVLHAVAAAGYN